MTPNDTEEGQGLLSLGFSQQQCLGGCTTEAGEAVSLGLCRLG